MELVFATILPGWKGRMLPSAVPWQTRTLIAMSYLVVDLLALLRHARTFQLLRPQTREALLRDMAAHRWTFLRRLVGWWKTLALLTHGSARPASVPAS